MGEIDGGDLAEIAEGGEGVARVSRDLGAVREKTMPCTCQEYKFAEVTRDNLLSAGTAGLSPRYLSTFRWK